VLFVAEVNGWAELSPTATHLSVASLVDRARAYGIDGSSVDGLDVREVHAAADRSVEIVRRTGEPLLLEVVTNRWRGHFEGDAQRYRDSTDLDARTAHDPVAFLRGVLVESVGDGEVAAIEAAVESEIAAAVEYARASPWPDPEETLDHVYATVTGRAQRGGVA
jgi:pyruvate dehydrogenase E1 component alpha subunit